MDLSDPLNTLHWWRGWPKLNEVYQHLISQDLHPKSPTDGANGSELSNTMPIERLLWVLIGKCPNFFIWRNSSFRIYMRTFGILDRWMWRQTTSTRCVFINWTITLKRRTTSLMRDISFDNLFPRKQQARHCSFGEALEDNLRDQLMDFWGYKAT